MAREEKQQAELMRIMGTDVRANSDILHGLSQIKGIGIMFSNAICHVLKLDKSRKFGSLTEKEIETVENFLSDPVKKGIPTWMLNNRQDFETGVDQHLIAKDIDFHQLQFRRRVSKLKTYKSLRYRANLPVRGQRTKSNFRRNKTLAAMKSKKGGRN